MTRAILLAVLTAIPLGVAIASETRAVTIENKTTGVLRGVYASGVDDDNWHTDRLTENVQPGGTTSISLPGPACRFDIRVLLEQRPSEVLLMGIDVCKAPVVTIDETTGKRIVREVE